MCTGNIKFTEGKVSIVTPVFNGENHLFRILESVLRQTYPQIEMILSDDGSTDGTIRAAQEYRAKFAARGYDYRIVQGSHKNASAAINRGLKYVTGEYLIWPDSDDLLEPESVEKRVKFLERNPDYQCVRSLPYYVDPETGESKNAEEQIGSLTEESLFWNILEFKTFVCCGCYMIKSECFFSIYQKRHIPEYPVGQNFQMLLPYMFRYKCPTIQEQLYGVCVREDSHSRRKLTRAEEEKKYLDYEKLIDDISEICDINDKESKRLITCWKAKRRYVISVKYGCMWRAVCALWLLFINRGFTKELLKDSLWRIGYRILNMRRRKG